MNPDSQKTRASKMSEARGLWRRQHTGNVLEEEQRDISLLAQLNEMGTLERRLGVEHAVVCQDSNRHTVQTRKPSDQSGPVECLELGESAAVHNSGDDLAHIDNLLQVGAHDARQIIGGKEWLLHLRLRMR
jgi:hypothetical protein